MTRAGGQAPRAEQRDPYDLGHLPLENGQILARGDQVRMGEASGHVLDVQRHAERLQEQRIAAEPPPSCIGWS